MKQGTVRGAPRGRGREHVRGLGRSERRVPSLGQKTRRGPWGPQAGGWAAQRLGRLGGEASQGGKGAFSPHKWGKRMPLSIAAL